MITEMNLMDSQKTPSDKLTCILNCCKVIICTAFSFYEALLFIIFFFLTTVLLTSGDSQAGADDFLPHLIYVLMKANPKNLASNMEYVLFILLKCSLDTNTLLSDLYLLFVDQK